MSATTAVSPVDVALRDGSTLRVRRVRAGELVAALGAARVASS
jgi:hypothetical protein